jgi:glycolate oxidase FAD binding subunit
MLTDAAGQRMDNAQAQADWTHCRNQSLPFFTRPPQEGMSLLRLSVPQTAPVLGLPWPQLVEWHGALRWLWAGADATDKLRAIARAAGGSASIFVTADAKQTGASGTFDMQDPAALAISRRLKASFDPHGVFNPAQSAA